MFVCLREGGGGLWSPVVSQFATRCQMSRWGGSPNQGPGGGTGGTLTHRGSPPPKKKIGKGFLAGRLLRSRTTTVLFPDLL